mgnify:FL=1
MNGFVETRPVHVSTNSNYSFRLYIKKENQIGTLGTVTIDCISTEPELNQSVGEPSRTVVICNGDGANGNETRIECVNHP